MVNASLNWASIVGIVLAVGGALLYFMRSFKPALARDYDVFFAAVGLLCGGILFFQGWRLDPILQFGQFLLAGTTVFFAYESVRLRGITTEQARRSSFFDDDEGPPVGPRIGGRDAWGNDLDRFDEPEPLRRRIRSRQGMDEPADEEDFYRPRTSPRPAIPERAVSRSGRGSAPDDWNQGPAPAGPRDLPPRTGRYGAGPDQADRYGNGPSPRASAYGNGGPGMAGPSDPSGGFGARRRDKDDARRGSRPSAASAPEDMPRSGRRPGSGPVQPPAGAPLGSRGAVPQGSPLSGSGSSGGGPYGSRSGPGQEPAQGIPSGTPSSAPRSNQPPMGRSGSPRPAAAQPIGDAEFRPMRPEAGPSNPSAERPAARSTSPAPQASPARDNSSRFDD